ncbi:hypothetical protein K450DRAFT_275976 [Umbelopsis ramanniana AG]|uniref:Uncharacterized protein n=1 Tax=Umbelopsis ramanniana AG TaxID=1314678 RepID=A0AAD5DZF0_UMBRA|nr:uncharacterized protein K450DRAFT_275976 [Umbelopsis ramanniana AG]KAI8575046.1 hypothetical protein K450DRAFT_275976 [Umbelopsis ramanniana AG]
MYVTLTGSLTSLPVWSSSEVKMRKAKADLDFAAYFLVREGTTRVLCNVSSLAILEFLREGNISVGDKVHIGGDLSAKMYRSGVSLSVNVDFLRNITTLRASDQSKTTVEDMLSYLQPSTTATVKDGFDADSLREKMKQAEKAYAKSVKEAQKLAVSAGNGQDEENDSSKSVILSSHYEEEEISNMELDMELEGLSTQTIEPQHPIGQSCLASSVTARATGSYTHWSEDGEVKN